MMWASKLEDFFIADYFNCTKEREGRIEVETAAHLGAFGRHDSEGSLYCTKTQ
jgi:hypothetical protein